MKNKQREWIDRHPITWKIICVLSDFSSFFLKFMICMCILSWLLLWMIGG